MIYFKNWYDNMLWVHERNISLIHQNLYLVEKKNDNDYLWELYIFMSISF